MKKDVELASLIIRKESSLYHLFENRNTDDGYTVDKVADSFKVLSLFTHTRRFMLVLFCFYMRTDSLNTIFNTLTLRSWDY